MCLHVQDAHDVHDLKGRRDTCEGVFPNEDAKTQNIARHPRCPLVESPDGCRSLAVPATWPTRRTTLVSSSAKNENVLVLRTTLVSSSAKNENVLVLRQVLLDEDISYETDMPLKTDPIPHLTMG
ncbi:hypothetical protein M514_02485 [Trichuris suis]|uniref:Uncharacterized protein n=1 Tax=Trichuris suis TaxID=68888 RepID=A0A085NFA8_9BILA|nr:hypothetical protein M514_02485 [Trichuris suis]